MNGKSILHLCKKINENKFCDKTIVNYTNLFRSSLQRVKLKTLFFLLKITSFGL